jgi:hypothetical protein
MTPSPLGRPSNWSEWTVISAPASRSLSAAEARAQERPPRSTLRQRNDEHLDLDGNIDQCSGLLRARLSGDASASGSATTQTRISSSIGVLSLAAG